MSNFISNLFGKSDDLKTIYGQGAIILDVRTPAEFRSGHIEGATNIPVDQIDQHIAELRKKQKPIITCCKSGGRSAIAKNTLVAAGLEAYNGGPWNSLNEKIK